MDNLERKVFSLISQSLDGLSNEQLKIDYKREWYNLADGKSTSEFLKDVTAIANTPGEEGYLIIGYDERSKSFHNSSFSNSNLADQSHLDNLLISRVDDLIRVNHRDIKLEFNGIEYFLSVLHIPVSESKPHLVKKYISKGDIEETERIFIRRNTSSVRANKSELDAIYRDRKNIRFDRAVNVSTNLKSLVMNDPNNFLKLEASLTFENIGRLSLIIHSFVIKIYIKSGEIFNFKLLQFGQTNASPNSILLHPIIIKPKKLNSLPNISFYIVNNLEPTRPIMLSFNNSLRDNIDKISYEAELNTGEVLKGYIRISNWS